MKPEIMPKSNHKPSRQSGVLPGSRTMASGFTLIELMITVTILGILTAAALPAFSGFIAAQRVKSASFDVMSMLSITRSEAIKRNTDVALSYAPPPTDLFTIAVVNPATTLYQYQGFKGVTTDCIGACPLTGVTYSSNGRLAQDFGAVKISAPNTDSIRCISIDLSGRPSSKTGGC